MNKLSPILLLSVLLAGTTTAQAADVKHGEELHAKNCITCHSSLTRGKPTSLYTRANRRVTSREGLTKQVRRCELSLGLKWFDEDIDDVAEYLNESYYHFGK